MWLNTGMVSNVKSTINIFPDRIFLPTPPRLLEEFPTHIPHSRQTPLQFPVFWRGVTLPSTPTTITQLQMSQRKPTKSKTVQTFASHLGHASTEVQCIGRYEKIRRKTQQIWSVHRCIMCRKDWPSRQMYQEWSADIAKQLMTKNSINWCTTASMSMRITTWTCLYKKAV